MSTGDLIKPLHGLRGAAALTVLVGHLAPIRSAPGLGVLLFFLISGFLIGRLYLDQPFSSAAVWKYAVARFARVYPLFALVVIGTGLLNHWLPAADVFHLAPAEVPAHLLLAGGTALTIWTISVEFQFYGLFVAIWFLRSRAASAAQVLVPLLLLACIGTVIAGEGAGTINLLRYLQIFVLGLIIAGTTTGHGGCYARIAAVTLPLFALAFGAAFLAIPYLDPQDDVYRDPAAILICVGLLVSALLAGESWANRLLSGPVAIWLGEVSFAVYLLHRLIERLVLALFEGELRARFLFAIMVVLTLIAAELSRRLIENPARAFLRRASLRVLPPQAPPIPQTLPGEAEAEALPAAPR